eukprot:TRINITY_DN3156_c0_g1_i4.p1 TRINITY_DN3156_c0_g1~~TRINITY_DN3156_c0_g1_i4.p1  ORF type:complete len:334 (-),score=94.53 TRINITY_DN3156_c0_g1_i4:259-1260(-)
MTMAMVSFLDRSSLHPPHNFLLTFLDPFQDWSEYLDESTQNYYYYNNSNGESQWTLPPEYTLYKQLAEQPKVEKEPEESQNPTVPTTSTAPTGPVLELTPIVDKGSETAKVINLVHGGALAVGGGSGGGSGGGGGGGGGGTGNSGLTSVWVEYYNDEQRPYYYNKATGHTQWDIPEDYRLYKEQLSVLHEEGLNRHHPREHQQDDREQPEEGGDEQLPFVLQQEVIKEVSSISKEVFEDVSSTPKQDEFGWETYSEVDMTDVVLSWDFKTKEGLTQFNNYMATRSYVRGWVPSCSDYLVLRALENINCAGFVNLLRWYNHISFLKEERKATCS